MSKSPNFLVPALGGAALVMGVAYGVASRDYGAARIDTLQAHVEKASAEASVASEQAEAEAQRVAEMEAKIAEIQAAANMQMASAGGVVREPAPVSVDGYGLGRVALPEEIAAWDVDVLPDGRGLPEGRGDALTGEEVFADQCASCHGDFAEGVDNWPVLAGGFDTLADKDPVKTVGSYWPYLSTVWDYVHRSMPFGAAQTLEDDDVYAIVAYILYSNDLVDEDFELSHENFADFQMYNVDGFIVDDREESEYAMWRAEPCMENCKDSVEITMRASVLDVTPDEGGDEEAEVTPAVATTEETTEAATEEASASAIDPELIAAGEKAFKKCAACHQVGEGAKAKTGPHLNAIIGRTIGGMEGFRYSNVFKAAAEEGRVWDEASLAEFLAKPKTYFKGTKMSFAGFKKEDDIAAVIAYLMAESP
jgi:cytochrome c